nr:hypothetical protein CFP56_29085 [Quercus suber]
MESEELDDTSIKRNTYRSSQKRKSKSTSDEVINYNNNDTIIRNPADLLLLLQKKGLRKGPKRKKYWYGTLSVEQKKDLRNKRREAYAQKKALAKEAITNNQLSVTKPLVYTIMKNFHANIAKKRLLQIHVKLDDAAGHLMATLFGDEVEKFLSCSAIKLMKEITEDGIKNIERFVKLSADKNFLIQVRAIKLDTPAEPRYKFNIVAIHDSSQENP